MKPIEIDSFHAPSDYFFLKVDFLRFREKSQNNTTEEH